MPSHIVTREVPFGLAWAVEPIIKSSPRSRSSTLSKLPAKLCMQGRIVPVRRMKPWLWAHPARLFAYVIEKCLEFAGSRRMAQLAQSLGFDLANALAGDGERPANLLQRPLRTVLHTKAHPDDLLLPRPESSQHLRSPLLKVYLHDRLGGRNFGAVFDEVAEA